MKKKKIHSQTMYAIYSQWGIEKAFKYKQNAKDFVDKFQSHNMDIVYIIIKGKFSYQLK